MRIVITYIGIFLYVFSINIGFITALFSNLKNLYFQTCFILAVLSWRLAIPVGFPDSSSYYSLSSSDILLVCHGRCTLHISTPWPCIETTLQSQIFGCWIEEHWWSAPTSQTLLSKWKLVGNPTLQMKNILRLQLAEFCILQRVIGSAWFHLLILSKRFLFKI